LLRIRKENIQNLKQKFIDERSAQMADYWEIFKAFNKKLDKDINTDAENR
jgi:hypothetical protein